MLQRLVSCPFSLLVLILRWACTVHRLLEVIHAESKLFLVFEFLEKDLKKYMDSQPGGIDLMLIKVRKGQLSSSARRDGAC